MNDVIELMVRKCTGMESEAIERIARRELLADAGCALHIVLDRSDPDDGPLGRKELYSGDRLIATIRWKSEGYTMTMVVHEATP